MVSIIRANDAILKELAETNRRMLRVLEWIKREENQMPKSSVFGVDWRKDGKPRVRVDFVEDFDSEGKRERGKPAEQRIQAHQELRALMEQSVERGARW